MGVVVVYEFELLGSDDVSTQDASSLDALRFFRGWFGSRSQSSSLWAWTGTVETMGEVAAEAASEAARSVAAGSWLVFVVVVEEGMVSRQGGWE